MRKILWFLVGFLFFALVWLNRADVSSLPSIPALKEAGTAVILAAWSVTIIFACKETWLPSQRVTAPKLGRLSRAGLVALVLQYGLGAISRNLGAGLSCPNFPGCANSFFPFNLESSIAFFHRWCGILMLGLFIHLSIAAIRTAPELLSSARRATALGLAQIFLGIGVVMTQLNPDSRLVHASIGYALWGVLVFIYTRTGGFLQASASAK